MEESSESTDTKKVVNPRVEIDTSPPFESVKEAVDRFGGSGPWIPQHILRLSSERVSVTHETEEFNVEKIEQQAMQLERDLMIKEQETLNVLKELESAKRFCQGLKLSFLPELSSFWASPDINLGSHLNCSNENLSLRPFMSPGSMFMELNRAKSNLNKTSIDLAVIQESVESLNNKMRRDKVLLERTMKIQEPAYSESVMFRTRNPSVEGKGIMENYTNISMETKPVDFETEQLKKMTEASRYEVMKAMAEIERTRNSIKMAEMRLHAAKKMEEAAKAVEAIVLADKNAENPSDSLSNHSNGITLSFDEYSLLMKKAQQVEEMCKTKFVDSNTIQRKNEDHPSDVRILEKFEETIRENKQTRRMDLDICQDGLLRRNEDRHSKFRFRNSHSACRNAPPVHQNGSNGMTSMGEILGRKVILQDDIIVRKHVENHEHREHTSLSEMLCKQNRLILHPSKTTEEGNTEKAYFVQRKKFGFIQVLLSIKKTKKNTQPLNTR